MTMEDDRNNAACDMVVDRAQNCITKLKTPINGVCPDHANIAEGVSLSLQMLIPTYRRMNESADTNQLTFGKLKIKGADAINSAMRLAGALGIVYIILKLNGKIS